MNLSGISSLSAEQLTYALSFLSSHLYGAGEYERVFSLVNRDWMMLKFRLTRSHRSFIDDLEISKRASMLVSPPSIAQLTQGVILIATLKSYASRIPPEVLGELARRGEVDQALAFADLVVDLGVHARALELIADAEEGLGHTESAINLRVRASRLITQNADTPERNPTSELLAAIQGGDRHAMRRYYRTIQYGHLSLANGQSPPMVKEALDISAIMDLSNDSDKAAQLTSAIRGMEAGNHREQLGKLVATVQADKGFTYRPEILGLAGRSLVSLGAYTQAWAVAEMLTPDTARDLIMAGIDEQSAGIYAMDYGFAITRLEARMEAAQEAVANALMVSLLKQADKEALEKAVLATEGSPQEASLANDMLRVVCTVKNDLLPEEAAAPNQRKGTQKSENIGQTFAQIAMSLAEIGKFDQAKRVLDGISSRVISISVRCEIEACRIRFNQIDDVVAEVENLRASRDEELKIRLALTLAEAVQNVEHAILIRAVLTLLSERTDPYERVKVMTAAGIAFARIGCIEEATVVASSIPKGIRNHERSDRKNFMLTCRNGLTQIKSHIVQTLAHNHDFEKAFEITSTLKEDATVANFHDSTRYPRIMGMKPSIEAGLADALGALASCSADIGDRERLDAVLQKAQAIRSSWTKPVALAHISLALSKLGDFSKALEIADDGFNTARSRKAKDLALQAIGEAQFKCGMFVEALRSVASIDGLEERASAIHDVAAQIDVNGRTWLERLFTMTQQIKDGRFQPKALSGLGKACMRLQDHQGFNRCLEMICKLTNDTERRDALEGIAETIAERRVSEGFSWLLSAVANVDSVWPRVDLLVSICGAMISLNEVEKALEIWRSELQRAESLGTDAVYRVLNGVLSSLARMGESSVIFSIYEKVKDLNNWWGIKLRLRVETN